MKNHEFTAEFHRLRTHNQKVAGAKSPSFSFSIRGLSSTDVVPALVVHQEENKSVMLRRYAGKLYAAYDGGGYWNSGISAEEGATPAQVKEVIEKQFSPMAIALEPPYRQFKTRKKTIPSDDVAAEIARRASAFIFVDDRLHREVAEPVWMIVNRGYGEEELCRPAIVVGPQTPYPARCARFDRLDVAMSIMDAHLGRRRRRNIADPVGSVEILDPLFEPSFDAATAIALNLGDDIARKIESALPLLGREYVADFAMMCAGAAEVERRGREAAMEFCTGFAGIMRRMNASRGAIPDEIRNWAKEKTPALLARIDIAERLEAETDLALRP